MDFDSSARLALVLQTNDSATAIIVLLSHVVEYATDLDVVLSRDSTHLPFDLIAETDVVGTAWVWQLSPLVAQLPATAIDGIEVLPRLDNVDALSLLRGMPLSGETDVRWRWKEEEVHELQRLTADCIRTQLEAPTIDLGFLAVEGLPSEIVQQMVLSASELARCGSAVLPSSAAAALALDDSDAIDEVIATVGPDAWLAIHELLIGTIRDEVPVDVSSTSLPARRVQAARDPLPRALAASGATLRLLTWHELWSDSPDDVIEIDLGGETKRVVREQVAA